MANESTWSVAGTRPLPVFTGSSECWAFYETSGVPPAINIALGWVSYTLAGRTLEAPM